MRMCKVVQLAGGSIKREHTSESTSTYICMPLSNKCVRYCHTNIGGCSLNGAFIVNIILISHISFTPHSHVELEVECLMV